MWLVVKRHDKSSANGYGTSVWNWAICLSQPRCARPSLLLRLWNKPPPRLLHRAMGRSQKLCPGKRAASRVATLFLSQMAHSSAQRGSPCTPTSGAEKPMGACAWSMRPAFAVAAPAKLAGAVSMAGPRHQEASSSEFAPASPRCRVCSAPMVRLEPAAASAGMPAAAQPTLGSAERADFICQPTCLSSTPLPCTASALSSRLARAIRSQCARPNS